MKKTLVLFYGVFCYLTFLLAFGYLFGFLGNVAVPKSVDSGVSTSVPGAVLVDVMLLALFALQHTVMARPTFKRWWTRFVPRPVERSTYVLLTNITLVLLFWFWQPIDGVVWDVQNGLARAGLYGLFGIGWIIVFVATLQLNHFDLFGLRQVWLYFRGRPYTHLPFEMPLFYKYVRHPLYVGWILAFWATPTMSAGHLLFACVATAYLLIAIQFEERNLLEFHGESYARYRDAVRMLIPVRRGNPATSLRPAAESV